jgi:hypothetical protein
MQDIPLNPGIPGGRWARLRPLCGHDETLVHESGIVDVVAFIDRLLTPAPGTAVGPGCAAQLTVSDCDRLCASIYREYFGDHIEGRARCSTCHEPFDLSFLLPALVDDLAARQSRAAAPDERGIFTARDGRQFRLPTAGEQQEMRGIGTADAVAALLERCVVEGDPLRDTEAIEDAMEQAGALLDLDLAAVCPHCDGEQTVRFDMQSYLFRTLGYEKRFLLHEVHRIATAYGWAYDETMRLPREDRRRFVQLIEAERVMRRRATPWPGI